MQSGLQIRNASTKMILKVPWKVSQYTFPALLKQYKIFFFYTFNQNAENWLKATVKACRMLQKRSVSNTFWTVHFLFLVLKNAVKNEIR